MKHVALVINVFGVVLARPDLFVDHGSVHNSNSSDSEYVPISSFLKIKMVLRMPDIAGGDYVGDVPNNHLKGGRSGESMQNLIQESRTESGEALQSDVAAHSDVGSDFVKGNYSGADPKNNLSGGTSGKLGEKLMQVATNQSRSATQNGGTAYGNVAAYGDIAGYNGSALINGSDFDNGSDFSVANVSLLNLRDVTSEGRMQNFTGAASHSAYRRKFGSGQSGGAAHGDAAGYNKSAIIVNGNGRDIANDFVRGDHTDDVPRNILNGETNVERKQILPLDPKTVSVDATKQETEQAIQTDLGDHSLSSRFSDSDSELPSVSTFKNNIDAVVREMSDYGGSSIFAKCIIYQPPPLESSSDYATLYYYLPNTYPSPDYI